MIRSRMNAVTLLTIWMLCFVMPRLISAVSSAIVVKDLEGKSRTFFEGTNASAKALVFIFVLPDCPICNSYVPELKRLSHAFPQIQFYRVYADPEVTPREARQHSKEYDFGFPGLFDPEQQLVRKSGATRAPEAAVFSPNGKLVYRGRIDDRYVDFGKKREQPGHRDLKDALDAILKNEPVHSPDLPPIGCYIPTKEKSGL